LPFPFRLAAANSRVLRLLDEMPRHDVATYAPLISAHYRLGAPLDTLCAFLDMLAWGCSDEEGADDVVCPNKFTAAAVV
jgi:hypothetical protein